MAQDLQDQLAKRMAILRNLEQLLPNAIQVRRVLPPDADSNIQKTHKYCDPADGDRLWLGAIQRMT